MFEKKEYYISTLSLRNRYRTVKELAGDSCYERWVTVKDEQDNDYVIVFEQINNTIPDMSELFFELPCHTAIMYPLDLIAKSDVYICENEIGYVYPEQITEYQSLDRVKGSSDRSAKCKVLRLLCETIQDCHNQGIFLNGFDKRQVLIKAGQLRIRYNGFKNHYRNSTCKIPDNIAEEYSTPPWLLDVFSLTAIIFEYMYEWNPFCGMLTSFSPNEEYQFEVYYNRFRKKPFIFERKSKLNPIGFLFAQRKVVTKWQLTDPGICNFFHSILTMEIPKNYTQESVFEMLKYVIRYYQESEIFSDGGVT